MHTHAHTHTLRHTLMHTYAYAQQVKSDRQALSSLTSRHDMLLLLFLLFVSLLLLLDNCFRATEREGEGGRTGTGRWAVSSHCVCANALTLGSVADQLDWLDAPPLSSVHFPLCSAWSSVGPVEVSASKMKWGSPVSRKMPLVNRSNARDPLWLLSKLRQTKQQLP